MSVAVEEEEEGRTMVRSGHSCMTPQFWGMIIVRLLVKIVEMRVCMTVHSVHWCPCWEMGGCIRMDYGDA